ncbi:MAG: beta-N-acetylhexosaminidase [Chloroflexi bacterium]|nr:beta-N-acetylhexosaminidase [Chloroflexota bacterium]
MIKRLISILILLLTACTTVTPPTSPNPSTLTASAQPPNNPTPQPAMIDSILSKMTLEQKVGQLIVIGFMGPKLTPELRQMIEQYHIGNVILFSLNQNIESPQQLAQLNHDLQTTAVHSGHPGLFICIDQEGGRVTRLFENKGFTEFPSAMAIGATNKPENAERIARAIAVEMKTLGLNVNFAPVLDVNNNAVNPIIGTRSFSSDPNIVARFGVAFLKGLQSEGVLAFGKHFPGHGDTGTDSHIALPTVPHDLDRLNKIEFVPFKAAMQNDVAGIMTAHVTFPAIDPTEKLAATLSPKILSGLLRDEMKYNGLLVTDSLEMGAIGESGYPPPKAAATALKAGADLLLFNKGFDDHKKAIALIIAQVKSGEIPQARLDEAVKRILIAKQKFGVIAPAPINVGDAASRVGTAEIKSISRDIAAQSITLLRDDAKLLPLKPGANVYVIETPAFNNFGKLIGTSAVTVSASPTPAEITMVNGMARTDSNRIFIVGLAGATANSSQIKLVQELLNIKAKVVVVALRDPYDLMNIKSATTMIATYSSTQPSLEALANVLLGKAKPQGKLPVDLPDLYPLGYGMSDFAK